MQDLGSMMPNQHPGSMGPMQFPSSMGLMQHRSSTMPMQELVPWDTFGGGALGALGPIREDASALEAEGRHYGGRRPTKWGFGGEAPRNLAHSLEH